MRIEQKVFDVLVKEASKSSCKYKFGAVLVDDAGKIVSRGHNIRGVDIWLGSRPDYMITIHAELHAILGVSKHVLTRSSLYVFRMSRNGTIKPSIPCRRCQTILKAAGVRHVTAVLGVDNCLQIW